jgi:hypothetical protein
MGASGARLASNAAEVAGLASAAGAAGRATYVGFEGASGKTVLKASSRVAPTWEQRLAMNAENDFRGDVIANGLVEDAGRKSRGRISGDPGVIKRKYQRALDANHPESASASAELRVAKMLRNEGLDVHIIDDKIRLPGVGPGFTNDMTINGATQVDVKRLGGLGSNAAKNINKGVEQVGNGGAVVVVRGSEMKASFEQFVDFVENFTPKKSAKLRPVDERSLPGLRGDAQ